MPKRHLTPRQLLFVYTYANVSQPGLFPDKQTAAKKQSSLITSEKSQTGFTFSNVMVEVQEKKEKKEKETNLLVRQCCTKMLLDICFQNSIKMLKLTVCNESYDIYLNRHGHN